MLGLWLLGLYAFIAILSWVIICVLCYKPIGIPTYYDQHGEYRLKQYEKSERWRQAASLGASIVAAVGIPITSAICTKAAAVYCQRRSDNKAPPLTLRQMLALADKGWNDSAVLKDLITPTTCHRVRSALLLLSIFFVVIAFLIPLLRGALVSTVNIKVLTRSGWPTALEFQPSIADLTDTPQSLVTDKVIPETVNARLSDKQPYLWAPGQADFIVGSISNLSATIDNHSGPLDHSFSDGVAKNQFIATMPVGTDTGLYRNLALRLNVSVACESAQHADFPTSCPGDHPLSQTYTNLNDTGSAPFGNLSKPVFQIRICAPGDGLKSPWKGTTDRQDVYEEIWLDYQTTGLDPDASWEYRDVNFTKHCFGNSTLGYFELPNYWNGHVAGPLFDKVPIPGTNLSYHNWDEISDQYSLDAKGSGHGTAGPFLTAAAAILGPNTFFSTATSVANNATGHDNATAAERLCFQLRFPFKGLSDRSDNVFGSSESAWNQSEPQPSCLRDRAYLFYDIPTVIALRQWLTNFADSTKSTAAFTLATYATSNAIFRPRIISSSDLLWASTGNDLRKPHMSVAAMITITVLLVTQLLGLAFLAIYASRNPSWTEALDSWAMLRLGAELGPDMPTVSTLPAQRFKVLDEKSGFVGDAGVESMHGEVASRQLMLGGLERVRAGTMYSMTRVSK